MTPIRFTGIAPISQISELTLNFTTESIDSNTVDTIVSQFGSLSLPLEISIDKEVSPPTLSVSFFSTEEAMPEENNDQQRHTPFEYSDVQAITRQLHNLSQSNQETFIFPEGINPEALNQSINAEITLLTRHETTHPTDNTIQRIYDFLTQQGENPSQDAIVALVQKDYGNRDDDDEDRMLIALVKHNAPTKLLAPFFSGDVSVELTVDEGTKETLIQRAFELGNTETVKTLLSNGADITLSDDPLYNTLLHKAALSDNTEMVRAIVSSNATISFDVKEGVSLLKQIQNPDIKELIQEKIDSIFDKKATKNLEKLKSRAHMPAYVPPEGQNYCSIPQVIAMYTHCENSKDNSLILPMLEKAWSSGDRVIRAEMVALASEMLKGEAKCLIAHGPNISSLLGHKSVTYTGIYNPPSIFSSSTGSGSLTIETILHEAAHMLIDKAYGNSSIPYQKAAENEEINPQKMKFQYLVRKDKSEKQTETEGTSPGTLQQLHSHTYNLMQSYAERHHEENEYPVRVIQKRIHGADISKATPNMTTFVETDLYEAFKQLIKEGPIALVDAQNQPIPNNNLAKQLNPAYGTWREKLRQEHHKLPDVASEIPPDFTTGAISVDLKATVQNINAQKHSQQPNLTGTKRKADDLPISQRVKQSRNSSSSQGFTP